MSDTLRNLTSVVHTLALTTGRVHSLLMQLEVELNRMAAAEETAKGMGRDANTVVATLDNEAHRLGL